MANLALLGGAPLRTDPFPGWPILDDRDIEAVTSVLRSGKWWYGEKVREFEEAFAAFQGARFGITCTNGTAALELGLLACGIGAGDEVLVPPYTFIATASAVLRVNAIPVFADIELDTANLDPADAEAKLTDRTRALLPVHFAGLPVDMDVFSDLARRHGLRLVEDACHSWGTQWRGKGAGALGDCGAFSFQMSKNLTAGEGGILLTDDEELARLARSYSNIGRWEGEEFYKHYLPGGNLRMTELQAALLLVQLSRLEEQTLRRDDNARYLDAQLQEIPGLAVLRNADPRVTRRSWHLYIFRFLAEHWGGVTRDRFLEALRAEGLPSWAGYPRPLYRNPLFERRGEGPGFCPLSCPYYGRTMDYSAVSCPHAEAFCEQACWLTQSVLLGEPADMRDIVDAVRKVWENREALARG